MDMSVAMVTAIDALLTVVGWRQAGQPSGRGRLSEDGTLLATDQHRGVDRVEPGAADGQQSSASKTP